MADWIDLFWTYYICSFVSVFILTGRLSSPKPRMKKLKLTSLEESNLESFPDATTAIRNQDHLTQVHIQPKMVRKLSFLETVEKEQKNPFINLSWELSLFDRVRYSFLGPLLLPGRIILLFVSLLCSYIIAKISILGLSQEDLDKPLSQWRYRLQQPLKLSARGILLALGFHWIKIKGKKASSAEAPICVSNHIGFVEAIYLPAVCLLSMAVSRQENASIPIFGAIMKAMQCIFVSRTDKDSRNTVAREIERRTKKMRGQWRRPLLLFPEGTTSNGDAVICFKVGAFAPGLPVQPIALTYSSKYWADPSWCTAGPPPQELLFRLMCQLNNHMTIHFLPVYEPSPEEIADPLLYADNVRELIAKNLGVQTTQHSFDDVLLLVEAKKLGYQKSLKECVLELKTLRKILEIDLDRAKQYLQTFAQLDKQKRGALTYDEFIKAFGGSQDSEESRNLFSLLDVKDKGTINLAEYLVGLALLNEQGTEKFDGAVKLAFRVFDSSGQGRLNKQQSARAFRRLLPNITDALLDDVFNDADTDKDGTLSSEEFLNFARKNRDKFPTLKQVLF